MRALAGAVAATVIAGSLVIATISSAAASEGGTCDPYLDGTIIVVSCSSGAGASGDSSGGGSTLDNTCTFTALVEAQAKNLGVSWPPPRGKHWALMDCGAGTAPQAVLVGNATGAPTVTPRQLLLHAYGELGVPTLRPATAPPRGTDGLVGLPEWFWVSAREWHPRSVTVTAGSVWATATAAPVSLTFEPGTGLSPVTCTGPGAAYNRHLAAAQQHTNCSYTYLQSSAGLPGNAYRASVIVTWRITWTGSGGAGGVLDAGLVVPVGFSIGVAQGEALVTSP
jgi:hypothetical protein